MNMSTNLSKSDSYIQFTGKSTRFQSDFRILKARAAGFDLISNVEHFCKERSSCFLRETAVKRI